MVSVFANLSPVIVVVLGLLIIFSVGSWAIILFKLHQLASTQAATKRFLEFFWQAGDFETVYIQLEQHANSPPANVFGAAYVETKHLMSQSANRPKSPETSIHVSAIDNISRTLRKVSGLEIEKLERNLPFLATTSSTTPFIGLFGTVWGIMNAFQSIGEAGTSSIAIVAPGVAEALLTTAIGLAVAIPAVIGFNYLQNRVRVLVGEIDNFVYDYLNIIQRLFGMPK